MKKKFFASAKIIFAVSLCCAFFACTFTANEVSYEETTVTVRSADSSLKLSSTDFSKLCSSSKNTSYPTQKISKDKFTLVLSKGSNSSLNPCYASSKLRVYPKNTLCFTPSDGTTITKIVFDGDSGSVTSANRGKLSGLTWTGSATSSSPVTFTCYGNSSSGKKNISSITITYSASGSSSGSDSGSGSESGSGSSSGSGSTSQSAYITTGVSENTALYLGNPSAAVKSTAQETNYLMQKTTFALSYNNVTHNPNWVSWHFCSSDMGSVSRSDPFHSDTDLPSGWYKVTSNDYTGSGYTRGHMIPHCARTTTTTINNEVFAMTNMVPQIAENNNTVWEGLESTEVTWASEGKELYIICGPYYDPSKSARYMKSSKTSTKTIRIPDSTWRVEIILDKTASNDISRITSSSTVIAINVPNTSDCYSKAKSAGYSAKTAWKHYICTIDDIESMTGYDFFANLPDNIENTLEAKKYK